MYYPAIDADDKGHCVAWTSYVPGEESLNARVGDRTFVLCRTEAVGPPSVAGRGKGVWEVAATVLRSGNWRIERFLIHHEEVELLAAPDTVRPAGYHPESVRIFREGTVTFLACVTVGRKNRTVELFSCGDTECTRVYSSPDNLLGYRPSIVVSEGDPWVAYDAWDGRAYQIYAQNSTGTTQITRGPGWNINADIALGSNGRIWVCWVHTEDIVSSSGVVDARNTIQVARVGPADSRIRDVEDISHGLIDTDPNPKGVWGYLGRRRHPMLLLTSAGLKLIWEQKKEHGGSTRENTGVLWVRDLGEASESEPSALADNLLWYEVPGSKRAYGTEVPVACFLGVYTDERIVKVRNISLSKSLTTTRRLPQASWDGWKRIGLPDDSPPAANRPRIDAENGTFSLYWFDLHCHTVMSGDAEGEVDECVRTGRYKALLDGMLVTDNDHYVVPLNRYEWRNTWETMEELTEEGLFVPLTGYEWTSRPIVNGNQIVDHRSVILPQPTDEIVRWNEVQGNIDALYDFVQDEGGLVHAHHQNWRLTGHPVESNIEACSSWNPYLEIDPGSFHRALGRGDRVGLIGGSDEHRRNPGLGGALTGIWATSLTREHILEALRAHRCYATMGRRVILDFRVNGRPMGTTLKASMCEFVVTAISPVPIISIELYEDGKVIHSWACGDPQVKERFEHRASNGPHSYYVKLLLSGPLHRNYPANIQPVKGPRAWSSPIWVEA